MPAFVPRPTGAPDTACRQRQLIRDALRNYIEEREWLRTIRYERLKAREEEREEADGRTTR